MFFGVFGLRRSKILVIEEDFRTFLVLGACFSAAVDIGDFRFG